MFTTISKGSNIFYSAKNCIVITSSFWGQSNHWNKNSCQSVDISVVKIPGKLVSNFPTCKGYSPGQWSPCGLVHTQKWRQNSWAQTKVLSQMFNEYCSFGNMKVTVSVLHNIKDTTRLIHEMPFQFMPPLTADSFEDFPQKIWKFKFKLAKK